MRQEVWVLVEGDTDARFYSGFFNEKVCYIYPVYEKKVAVEVIQIINSSKVPGVIAIVDADYDTLGNSLNIPNLFFTDTHDIETLILKSPALEKTLKEYLPGNRLKKVQALAEDVRQALIEVGIFIGYLRWLSGKMGWNLSFKEMPLERFIDQNNIALDRIEVVRYSMAGKRGSVLSPDEIQQRVETEMMEQHDPWLICQGHDLVHILAIVLPEILKQYIGRDRRIRPLYHEIDRRLRLAYEPAFFTRTKLYCAIVLWERSHSVCILKEEIRSAQPCVQRTRLRRGRT